MPRLVFGSVAVDGATFGVSDVVVVVASDVASVEAAASTPLAVAASLAFSCSNLACMAFEFARAQRTITWQPLSMHALQIESTTE